MTIFAALTKQEPAPAPTVDADTLARKIRDLEDMERFRRKYGQNLTPEQIEFYKQIEETDRIVEEKHARNKMAEQEQRAREHAENLEIVGKLLTDGVVRVHLDGTRIISFLSKSEAKQPCMTPCPSCGAPFHIPVIWDFANFIRTVKSDRFSILQHLTSRDGNPFDESAGRPLYWNPVMCKQCNKLHEVTVQIVV